MLGRMARYRWVAAGALVVLAGGVVAAVALASRSTSAAPSPQARPVPPTTAAPTPQLVLDTGRGGRIAWDHPLTLHVHDGSVVSAAVTDTKGAALAGYVDSAGTTWQSEEQIVPARTYVVEAVVEDRSGRRSTRTVKATATDAPRLGVALSPGDGSVVGIGMPVVAKFDKAVPHDARATVEKALSVQTQPVLVGSWRWMSDNEAHWRPQSYWPAHTNVRVVAALDENRFLGDGLWGSRTRTAQFSVGDAHVSVADAATHQMVVTNNGVPVKTFPMSAGRDQYPSRSGVHIALEKSPTVTMDSATVGIPRNSKDGYFETVQWDVRISYGGAFVHAAPWSVASQGRANVSHGCINLAPGDAEWFYGFTARGDVVDVRNAAAPPDLADPGTADWNIPWDAWRAGSALPSTQPLLRAQ